MARGGLIISTMLCRKCSTFSPERKGIRRGYYKVYNTKNFIILRCRNCGADYKIEKEEKVKELCNLLYVNSGDVTTPSNSKSQ